LLTGLCRCAYHYRHQEDSGFGLVRPLVVFAARGFGDPSDSLSPSAHRHFRGFAVPAGSVPLSAQRQARPGAGRGQPADDENLEQPAVMVRVSPEHQLDPRWPGNRDCDHHACHPGSGKFGYDQSPAHRASLRIHGKLIDDVACEVQCGPPFSRAMPLPGM